MEDYHEPYSELSEKTKDCAKALSSLKEEVEAVSWYQQRADSTTDQQLKKILIHNRNEEIEHSCMLIEWLRRNMEGWDEELKTYLFTETDTLKVEIENKK